MVLLFMSRSGFENTQHAEVQNPNWKPGGEIPKADEYNPDTARIGGFQGLNTEGNKKIETVKQNPFE